MKTLLEKQLPKKLYNIIKVQTRFLIGTPYFSPQDREDIEQELFLFYLEKLSHIPLDGSQFSEGYFFIAFKKKALELMRQKRRYQHYIHEHSVNYKALNSEEVDSAGVENQIDINRILSFLSKKERDIFILILGGAKIAEISQKLSISRQAIYRILEKVQNNFDLNRTL